MKNSIFGLLILFFLFSGCVKDIDTKREDGYVDDAPRTDVGVQLSIADIIDANGTNIPFGEEENQVQGSRFKVQGENTNSNIINKIAPIDVDTSRMGNVWVFQFGRRQGSATNTAENSWVLIGNPYYADQEKIDSMYADPNGVLVLPLIETGITKNPGTENWVMFIANTNDPYFISNRMTGLQVGVTTFSSFKQMFIDIPDESYLYGGDTKNIMMSGGVKTSVKAGMVIDGDNTEPDDDIYEN
jgi:hypothetical protein